MGSPGGNAGLPHAAKVHHSTGYTRLEANTETGSGVFLPFDHREWAERRLYGGTPGEGIPERDELLESHRECQQEMAQTGWWGGDVCLKFLDFMETTVRDPGNKGYCSPNVDFTGAHYRVMIRKLPYYRFVSPV